MTGAPLSPVPIAVVGASALYAGSRRPEDFWRNILAGRDLITDVPADYFLAEDHYAPAPAVPDKSYCKRGGFLPKVPFDPLEFGIPPSALTATDPLQLLALVVARRALEDACQGNPERYDRARVAVTLGIVGVTQLMLHMSARLQRPVWLKALREEGVPEDRAQAICSRILSSYHPWQESSFPGWLPNVAAGRIANRLDLGGANCTVDAACASSLAAVDLAMKQLTMGEADLVLTGGADALTDPLLYVSFSQTPAFSPTGDCRPFSDNADGTLVGEGLAIFALRRLEDAERDGDRIHAVIRGMGASSDARAKSVYAPRAEGQVAALRRAYQAAGCGPETMDLLEAHGTGTQAGDVAEMEALRAVYDECGRPDRQWCALGTVKSQVGHTKAAAGAAGLFKAVMALRHAVLPPTIKVERPDPRLDLENSPFYLNTVARPWAKDPAVPRRAAVSAFGFGGANYHAVVEEYRGAGVKAWRTRTSPVELVVVCGKSVEEVAERCRHLAATVVGHPCLQFLARATQETYDPQAAARLGLVATDETDLKQKLLKAAEMCAQGGGKPVSDSGLGIHLGVGREEGLLAFMFPGQSSHYLGMGADLAFAFEQAQAVWDQAATYVYEDGTIPGAVFPRPAFDEKTKAAQAWRLVGTRWAQPAVACVARAHLNLLETMGVKPDCVGAHSYGDAVALHAAGCYDFPTLVGLCRKRGELVQQADQPNPGSMTSVVCSAQDIKALLAERPTAVTFAGENAAQSTVITGPLPDLVEVEKRLAERSIQFRRLPIDGSGHSMLHEPASKGWEAWMKNVRFRLPALPVFANSDPSPYPADEDAIKHRLAYEVSWPVRFVEQVEAMYAHGVRTFIEVGPGGVICQLLGLCLQGRPHRAINLDKRGQNGQATWWTALAQVVAAGVPATLAPLWAEYAPLADPREVKRSSTAVEISGTVYGKTYPPAGGASALPPPNPPGGAAWTGQPGSVPGMASLASVAPAETLSTLRDMAERLSAAHQSYQGAMTAALSAYQRSMTDNQAAVTRLGGSVPPPVRKENQ